MTPEQARRELLEKAARDGIALADAARKANRENGHELGDVRLRVIAVEHFLEVAKRHGYEPNMAEAARTVQAAFQQHKERLRQLPPG